MAGRHQARHQARESALRGAVRRGGREATALTEPDFGAAFGIARR